MTDDQFNEAQKLRDGGMSINKAAIQVGVNYSTLYRRLNKDKAPQATSESEPHIEAQATTESEAEAEPYIEAHPSLAAIDWGAIRHWTERPETQAQKTQRENDQYLVDLKRKSRNES